MHGCTSVCTHPRACTQMDGAHTQIVLKVANPSLWESACFLLFEFIWVIIPTMFIPETGEIRMCSSHGKREYLWFPVQLTLDCQAERPVWNKQALPLPGRIFGEPGGTEGSVCGVRKVPPLLTVYHVGCLHLISTALLS